MRSTLLFVLLLVSAATAQNKVWIVTPGGPFDPPADPQPTIDAAHDGDVLLFEAGNYAGCVIDTKGLALVADTGATVTLTRLVVRDLMPDQNVLVSGLTVRGEAGAALPLVELLHDEGAVLFRDVTVTDQYSQSLGGAPDVALRILDCGSVTLLDGLVTGRRNDEPFGVAKGSSAPAVELDGGQLSVFGGQVLGADGLNAFDTFTSLQLATPGDRAIVLKDGTILVSGAEVRGGHGGNGNSNFVGSCLDPAPGGHALDASIGSPVIVLHDSVVAGGTGGDGTINCPATGADGLPLFPASEPKEDLPGLHLPLLATPLAREGEPLALVMAGPPDSLAVLLVGSQPLMLLVPAKGGALLLQPTLIVVADVVPATGVLGLDLTAPPLPPGIEGLPILLQTAFSAPVGAVLGDASLLLLLDAAF